MGDVPYKPLSTFFRSREFTSIGSFFSGRRGVVPYTKIVCVYTGGETPPLRYTPFSLLPPPFSLKNIVVLLPLVRSQYSLFFQLIRVPSSVPDSGTLVRPNAYCLFPIPYSLFPIPYSLSLIQHNSIYIFLRIPNSEFRILYYSLIFLFIFFSILDT